jgi:hypothetical protein
MHSSKIKFEAGPLTRTPAGGGIFSFEMTPKTPQFERNVCKSWVQKKQNVLISVVYIVKLYLKQDSKYAVYAGKKGSLYKARPCSSSLR